MNDRVWAPAAPALLAGLLAFTKQSVGGVAIVGAEPEPELVAGDDAVDAERGRDELQLVDGALGVVKSLHRRLCVAVVLLDKDVHVGLVHSKIVQVHLRRWGVALRVGECDLQRVPVPAAAGVGVAVVDDLGADEDRIAVPRDCKGDGVIGHPVVDAAADHLELRPCRGRVLNIALTERRLRQEGQAHPVVEHAVEHDIGGAGGVGEVGGLDALLLRVIQRVSGHPLSQAVRVRVGLVGADQCNEAGAFGVFAKDDGVRAPTAPTGLSLLAIGGVTVVGAKGEAELLAGRNDVQSQ